MKVLDFPTPAAAPASASSNRRRFIGHHLENRVWGRPRGKQEQCRQRENNTSRQLSRDFLCVCVWLNAHTASLMPPAPNCVNAREGKKRV